MGNNNVIQEKSFEFALSIISLYRRLVIDKEYIISKQLLRSGTSIGANIEEAMAGQSKKDFTAKMAIASKEARETNYWLRLLDKSELVEINVLNEQKAVDEIIRILTAIVKTSQKSLKDN